MLYLKNYEPIDVSVVHGDFSCDHEVTHIWTRFESSISRQYYRMETWDYLFAPTHAYGLSHTILRDKGLYYKGSFINEQTGVAITRMNDEDFIQYLFIQLLASLYSSKEQSVRQLNVLCQEIIPDLLQTILSAMNYDMNRYNLAKISVQYLNIPICYRE